MSHRFLSASILAMAAVDITLTGVFIHQRLQTNANQNAAHVPALNNAIGDSIATTIPAIRTDVKTWMTQHVKPGDVTSEVFDDPSTQPSGAGAKSEALFLLMRSHPSGAQPVLVCPSSMASKWDYGGGTNTVWKWTNGSLTMSESAPQPK